MNIPFNITDKGVTVFVNGKPCSFARDHANHDAIREAVLAGDEATVRALADVRTHVKTLTLGRVEIGSTAVYIDGREVRGTLVNRIMEMVRLGSDAVSGYVRFLDNLHNNPSNRAVEELWGFVEACDLPITSDGCFLAYRTVNGNYMDFHSGTVLNMPADLMDEHVRGLYSNPVIGGRRDEVTIQVVDGSTVISCPRNMVNEDKDQTCSEGLHFCSYSYLSAYGGHGSGKRVIVVKINPADVVAIPSDYNNAKGRTAKYTVMSEMEDWEGSRITPYFTDEYEADCDDEYDDEYDEEDDYDDFLEEDDEDFDDVLDDVLDDIENFDPRPFGGATLTRDQVGEIKRMLRDTGMTLTAIGAVFGVHRETIARIRDGRTWADVEANP